MTDQFAKHPTQVFELPACFHTSRSWNAGNHLFHAYKSAATQKKRRTRNPEPGTRNSAGTVCYKEAMIIGLTGKNAAGKGEVARFLQDKGFYYHSLSDVLREELKKRGRRTDSEQPDPDWKRAAQKKRRRLSRRSGSWPRLRATRTT